MRPALLILVLFLSGCGYALVGKGNFLPADAKTVQIPTFVNRTTRVELEQRVTRAVAEEMVSRSGLRLVSEADGSDLIVKGIITSFGINPVAFDEQGRATQYQITVRASIQLLDHRAEDAVLWKNDQYYFTDSYPINPESGGTFDQETQAINDIAVRFAESLVSSLLEGF
ncbi:MAG: LPS assembly lipoprotein LptE [Thermoanaerobaculia bacterium]|nr:LPS assembly lipoprotein LptE [Thermoanaerobaculia bacterium]